MADIIKAAGKEVLSATDLVLTPEEALLLKKDIDSTKESTEKGFSLFSDSEKDLVFKGIDAYLKQNNSIQKNPEFLALQDCLTISKDLIVSKIPELKGVENSVFKNIAREYKLFSMEALLALSPLKKSALASLLSMAVPSNNQFLLDIPGDKAFAKKLFSSSGPVLDLVTILSNKKDMDEFKKFQARWGYEIQSHAFAIYKTFFPENSKLPIMPDQKMMAIGDGSVTRGVGNGPNLGRAFFNYDLQYSLDSKENVVLNPSYINKKRLAFPLEGDLDIQLSTYGIDVPQYQPKISVSIAGQNLLGSVHEYGIVWDNAENFQKMGVTIDGASLTVPSKYKSSPVLLSLISTEKGDSIDEVQALVVTNGFIETASPKDILPVAEGDVITHSGSEQFESGSSKITEAFAKDLSDLTTKVVKLSRRTDSPFSIPLSVGVDGDRISDFATRLDIQGTYLEFMQKASSFPQNVQAQINQLLENIDVKAKAGLIKPNAISLAGLEPGTTAQELYDAQLMLVKNRVLSTVLDYFYKNTVLLELAKNDRLNFVVDKISQGAPTANAELKQKSRYFAYGVQPVWYNTTTQGKI